MTQIRRINATRTTRRFFHASCFSSLRRLDLRPFTVDCQLLLVLAITLGAGVAWGQEKKSKALPPPPPDLPGHVNYLAKQLIGVPLDESDPLTSRIQKLVLDHLDEWMASRTPSVVEPRRELERVFALLRNPLSADANSFSQPWKSETLIGVGYTLRWTDYNRVNVLALYENRDAKSRRVALSNFVPHTDQHYEILPSPESEISGSWSMDSAPARASFDCRRISTTLMVRTSKPCGRRAMSTTAKSTWTKIGWLSAISRKTSTSARQPSGANHRVTKQHTRRLHKD